MSATVHELYGRRAECETLDQLVEEVQAGNHAVLVLRGNSGEGKTALLDHLADRAAQHGRVVRVAGVEAEMELPYAGLQQLCATMFDQLDALPVPQRDALRVTFGLAEGAAPDRFLVGLAVLTLLSDVASQLPLYCVVDDAQWLDRASVQALAFAARRLQADPVALVFAVRRPSGERELVGLPELNVAGLNHADARLLLASAVHGRLDERVCDRIVAETRGNPLALLELPRGLTPAELAGGFGLPDAQPLASRIEQGFVRRLRPLPAQARQFLLVAAAEPIGDPTLLRRATAELGLTDDAAAPAEAAGLIEIGTRVRFRHPLVRSAVYRAATLTERRRVHQVLADATDAVADPDRRAWHLAAAAPAPDAAVAEELERSAERAQARGGVAAAAAFLERATELTPDPARRGARALAAAQAKFDAGDIDTTRELLATAEMSALDGLQRARVERLRAQLAFAGSRGRDAPPLLLGAAERLSALDAAMARETYLEALLAAIYAGRLGDGEGVLAVAKAALSAPAAAEPPRAVDLLLDGLATRFAHGYVQAAPIIQRSLSAYRSEYHRLTWVCLATSGAAMDLWDDQAWLELATRQVQLAREAGTLNLLPLALDYLAGWHVQAGELAGAATLLEEAAALNTAVQVAPPPFTSLILAAWRGDRESVDELHRDGIRDASARGEGNALAMMEYATAVLHNGLGLYGSALDAAREAGAGDELATGPWALAELVEAAARTDEREVGEQALRRLAQRTRASGTQWALGVEARCRALLSEGAAAEALYREAVERLDDCRMAAHLARAHLVYGEWLRRQRRRADAREHLHRAHDMLTRMGAEAFGERARGELLATGETVRRPSASAAADLTAQEALIARLASAGYTNPEIGAQLFLSPRTVEWHLRKVFAKLAINSRRELRNTPLQAKAALPV
ncbi:AAA family ATPase [Catellatospora sp. NPDC049609]|uniref:helix-turn-helix transcriptional regulator n=1 Tax=Catellatospora sp. NPDC049609 TaxID=3155505 RepID=UPI0034419817